MLHYLLTRHYSYAYTILLVIPVILSAAVCGAPGGFITGLFSYTANYSFNMLTGIPNTLSVLFLIGHTLVLTFTGSIIGILHTYAHKCRNEVKRREEIEEKLRWQKNLLEKAIEDKNRSYHEMNYRVMDNYAFLQSFISLAKSSHNEQPEIIKVLKIMEARITALSEVQRMIYDSAKGIISLKHLVEVLVQSIVYEHSGPERIAINCEITDTGITSETASHLALVLNELLINTIEYAVNNDTPTSISVISHPHEDTTMEFVYMDSGPGFPDSVFEDKKKGMGLLLVESIVRESLGGRLEFINNRGAVVRFYFKRENDRKNVPCYS